MHEQEMNNLGGPEPVNEHDDWGFVQDLGMIVAVLCSGFVVFTQLVAPARLSGATRSARLRWQQHDQEVKAAIGASAIAPDPSPHEPTK